MAQNPSSQGTILLVDDDKFLLDMYSVKFSNAGYQVKAADSTDLGLKILREGFDPDVILCDITMPGPDGLELVSIARAEHIANKAVVVMLTNQGSSDDIARARRLSVDGYIVKATTIPSEVLTEVEKIRASKKS